MKTIWNNLQLVLKDKKYLITFFIVIIIFLSLWFLFFDYKTSLGNLWKAITYWEIILHTLISLLFASFVIGQIYKINILWNKKTSHKTSGFLWWIFGILITGCPSCGIGIASYLGLAGILSFLPRYGLELKIAAVLLLVWSNYSLYKNLLICKRKN